MVNPVQHAQRVIGLVRQESNEAILFFSGGKDSLALLDLIAPKFDRLVCVFMYFVKGLEHMEKYLDITRRYPSAEILQVPHWILSTIYREGVYCVPDAKVPLRKLKDVRAYVQAQTGIDWVFMGMKQSDSLQRRLMLKGYEEQAISRASTTAYPLSIWKKGDVLAYLKFRKLPMPINYGIKTNSSGLVFNTEIFDWLRTHYPQDLEKIYAQFPLSRQLLFEYDYANTNKISDGDQNDPQVGNQKRAIQSAPNQ